MTTVLPPARPAAGPRAAGPSSPDLRYVTDAEPGIRRRRSGLGFSYLLPSGRPVKDAKTLERIRSLAIPPAWKDVWICRDRAGHLQATGRDQRGRKQYRYHPLWRAVRDRRKYDKLYALGVALPRLRRRVRRDLARRGLPRPKVLAAVVSLLETTHVRVGSPEYARQNGSFGLTTLRDSHARIFGSRARLEFPAKGGKRRVVEVSDRRLVRIVRQSRDLPGQQLFQYLDEADRCARIHSGDVNEYLREACGEDLTAKDFRTWSGSVLALRALRAAPRRRSATARRRQIVQAVDQVALCLGNTRSVCRTFYIHPGILELYEQGVLEDALRTALGRRLPSGTETLAEDERCLLALLHHLEPLEGARRLPRSSRRAA